MKLNPRHIPFEQAKTDFLGVMIDWKKRHPKLTSAEILSCITWYLDSCLEQLKHLDWEKEDLND